MIGENWNKDIEELETYFSSVNITEPIKMNKHSIINNVPLFIKGHLGVVKKNNGNSTFLTYLERLKQLKTILSKQ